MEMGPEEFAITVQMMRMRIKLIGTETVSVTRATRSLTIQPSLKFAIDGDRGEVALPDHVAFGVENVWKKVIQC